MSETLLEALSMEKRGERLRHLLTYGSGAEQALVDEHPRCRCFPAYDFDSAKAARKRRNRAKRRARIQRRGYA